MQSVTDVPSAVQQLRRAMFDTEVSMLSFQSMDRLFTTRTVPRSGSVWRLPRADHPLDSTYAVGGTHT
jgi:hypothetical protein